MNAKRELSNLIYDGIGKIQESRDFYLIATPIAKACALGMALVSKMGSADATVAIGDVFCGDLDVIRLRMAKLLEMPLELVARVDREHRSGVAAEVIADKLAAEAMVEEAAIFEVSPVNVVETAHIKETLSANQSPSAAFIR